MPRFSNFLRNSINHFSQVFIFGNKFHESRGFVAVPVTKSKNFVTHHQLDRDKLEQVSLTQLETGIATKPRLAGNILSNIKTCENS